MAEHFDVCVLGGQPAAFITAALLAKRGMTAVLIDNGEGFDQYRQGGVVYPLNPQPLPGLRGSKLVDAVLVELGAQVDFPRRYVESVPSYQVVFPRHRVDIVTDREALTKEVQREFNGLSKSFKQAIQHIDQNADFLQSLLSEEEAIPAGTLPQRFFQKRRLGQKIEAQGMQSAAQLLSVDREHPLKEMFTEAMRFFSHYDEPDPPAVPFGFTVARLLSGAVRVEGPTGSYLEALSQLATQVGVSVRRGTQIEQLIGDRSRISGVELSNARGSVSADQFVSGLYSHQIWQTLPQSRTLMNLVSEQGKLRSRGKLYVHHFLIQERGVIMGMADNVLLLNGRRQGREGQEEDTPVWVTLRRQHSKDHALLSAAIFVKESEASSLPERLEYQRKRVRKQIERLMPFLPEYIVAESSPMAPSEWDPQQDTFTRKLDTWALHPLYEPPEERLLGMTGLPFQTPYKNLHRTGREVLPALGALGDFVSARMAAALVQKAKGKGIKK